jgi:hypothetical protein
VGPEVSRGSKGIKVARKFAIVVLVLLVAWIMASRRKSQRDDIPVESERRQIRQGNGGIAMGNSILLPRVSQAMNDISMVVKTILCP